MNDPSRTALRLSSFAHINIICARNLLLMVGVLLFLVMACRTEWSPGIRGDGFEYMAISEAFVRHATPDVRAADFREIAKTDAHDAGLVRLAEKMPGDLSHINGFNGFWSTKGGRLYSYHFWLYPLMNVPAMELCQRLGISSDNSFLLTNAWLLLALIGLIAFGTSWPWRRKALLAFLILACGSTFYLDWPSPEVMTFAFLLGGLVLLEERRHGSALIALAIAAQQNPPVGFLAVLVGCIGCYQVWAQWRYEKRWMGSALGIARLVPGAIILGASPLFYLINFGTPSLIMQAGYTDSSLISGRRMFSLFFDPNQGMVLAIPAVFVVLLLSLAVGLRVAKRRAWLALLLVVIVILMAIPTLSSVNWNSGATIISRYAFWLSAPILYATALSMACTESWLVFAGYVALLVLSQTVLLSFYGIRGDYGVSGKDKWGYVYPSALSEWLMDRHPSWYRPLPEIFVERGMHTDGSLKGGFSYFYVRHGYMTTLLSEEMSPYALRYLCHIDPRRLRVDQSARSWGYRDLKKYCPLNWPDGFYALPDHPVVLALAPSVPCNLVKGSACAKGLLTMGFSRPEIWGTWSDKKVAIVSFMLPPSNYQGRIVDAWRLTFKFAAFTPHPAVTGQRVIVSLNGDEKIDAWITSAAAQKRSLIIPRNNGTALRSFETLVFVVPTAISPKSVGLSSDGRKLGIGLISLRLDPALAH